MHCSLNVQFGSRPARSCLRKKHRTEEEFIYHRPVLLREAIELLAPRPGALVLDATCGGGGHSEAILKTGADVLALDQDPDAIAEATNRLSEFGDRVTLRKANFRHADRVLDELKVGKIGGAILDLGVSSRQLENAERGFSLMRNGPLDMRMDPRRRKNRGCDHQQLQRRRVDPTFSRSRRRTGRASHRQCDCEAAQDRAIS